MKTVTIRLTMMTDNVKNFVSLVNRYPYDMDLRSGRYVVDAKSILGIFSIDLSRPITMSIYSDDCDDLLRLTWTATSSRTMGRTLPNNRSGTIIQNRRCGSCLLTRMLRKKKTS